LNFVRFSKILKKSKIVVDEKDLMKSPNFCFSKMKTLAKKKGNTFRKISFLGTFRTPIGNFWILFDFRKFQKNRKSLLGKKIWWSWPNCFFSKMKNFGKKKGGTFRKISFLGTFRTPIGNFWLLVDFRKFQKIQKSLLCKKFWWSWPNCSFQKWKV